MMVKIIDEYLNKCFLVNIGMIFEKILNVGKIKI